MINFDRDDLIAFVQGVLPSELAAEVRRAARTDPDLAARIEALAAVAGQPLMHSDPLRPSTSSRRRFLMRSGLALGGITAIGVGAVLGHDRWFVKKPIIADDFDDGWIDIRIWETRLCRPRVKEENGYLRMINRGSLVTVRQFQEPIAVQLDWMWIDRGEHPLYPDVLRVALRSTGLHHAQGPQEILDGVVVEFNPHSGKVWILVHEWIKDDPMPVMKRLAISTGEPLPIASGVWHTIQITDDGKRVAASITGGKIKGQKNTEPVVEAETEATGTERRIAIYNRERLDSVDHESRIDNFFVRALG